jgi:hypothetical protein
MKILLHEGVMDADTNNNNNYNKTGFSRKLDFSAIKEESKILYLY